MTDRARALVSPVAAAIAVVAVTAVGSGGGAMALVPPAAEHFEHCWQEDAETGTRRIDAACFFRALLDHYRGLTAYADVASVTQTRERTGEAPRRVQTRVGCTVIDGKLHVRTPLRQWRRALGLDVMPRQSPWMEDVARRYDVWLAPHMALKFADEPRRPFRAGAKGPLRATEAQLTQDDKPMVHLELRAEPDASGEEPDTFDLYVNPDSMLVERFEGQQRMPDGASLATTVDITPTLAASTATPDPIVDPAADPAVDPAPLAAPIRGADAPAANTPASILPPGGVDVRGAGPTGRPGR